MPEMDGFELIAADPQAHRASAICPIVLLTSSASPGDQERATSCGVAARLLKPVKQSLLLDNIMRVLAGASRPQPRQRRTDGRRRGRRTPADGRCACCSPRTTRSTSEVRAQACSRARGTRSPSPTTASRPSISGGPAVRRRPDGRPDARDGRPRRDARDPRPGERTATAAPRSSP